MLVRPLALLVGVTLGAACAHAQDANPATSDTAPAAEAAPAGLARPTVNDTPLFADLLTEQAPKSVVDESALRYYASQKNTARVEAETRRLKALYPNWKVPKDLYGHGANGNGEQVFWDLFGADKLDELKARIAERMGKEPGWKPSYELDTKIVRKEARTKLVAASDAHQWAGVLDLARLTPALLTCADMDVDWRVAESFARSGAPAKAGDIYHAILTVCTDPDERLATVRKSIEFLPTDAVRALIGMGRTFSDGSGEFDVVRLDLIRARIGGALAGKANDLPSPDELKQFADAVGRSHDPADIALLAWYHFNQKSFDAADLWFKQGLADPKLAEGHLLVLRETGRVAEAEQTAYEWRERSPGIRAIYIGFLVAELTRPSPPPDVAPERLLAFMRMVSGDRSSSGAQALAWYYYNRASWLDAVYWFGKGVDWADPKVADAVGTKTVEGYALALKQLGRLEAAEDILYHERARGADLRSRYIEILVQEMGDAAQTAMSDTRLDRFTAIVTADRSALGAQALGWYRLRQKGFAGAVEAFENALAWSGEAKADPKLAEGYGLALRGAGRFAEAEALAYGWIDRSPELRALYVNIVIEEMTTPELAAKLTDERVGHFAQVVSTDRSDAGAQAMAWYGYGRKDRGFGIEWFERAIAWSADGRGDAKVNEGYALALRAAERLGDAEAVAAAWMDRAEAMRTLYIQVFVRELTLENPPPAIPEERVARFVSVIGPLRAHVGAQALGWYRYERGEHADGAKWFRSALDWWPPVATAARGTVASVAVADRDLPAPLLVARLDGKAPISAPVAIGVPPSRALQETDPNGPEAYAKTWEGYALTLRGLGRLEDAERIAYDWRDRSASLRALFIEMAVTALTRGAAPPAPERLDRYTTLVRADRSVRGAQALGWFWTDRKDWTQAADWFRSAIDWSDKAGTDTDPKVVQGYGLALRNLGRSDDVMALVAAWRDRIPGMESLAVDLWLDELRALKPPAAMAPDRLARVVAQVTGDRSAVGAQALGWYFYGRTDAAQASAWFKSSFDWSPDGKGDPKAAEGYALALRSAGKLDDALRLADDWRERAPEMGSLYLDLATDLLSGAHPPATLPGDFLTRIGSLATAARAPQVAAALGWYRLEHRGADQAAEWFKSAIDWSADRKGDPKVNEGYVLALRSLGRASDAEAITAAWADSNDALRAQYVDILAERLGDPKNADPATEDTLRRFAQAIQTGKSSKGAQALGWYRLRQKGFAGAVEAFENALAWSGEAKADPKLAEGYGLALRGAGRFAEAEALAYGWIDRSPELRALYVNIVIEEMTTPELAAKLTDERVGHFAQVVSTDRSDAGAQAMAWYGYGRKDRGFGIEWFERAIAWSADGRGDAKVNEGYALALRAAERLGDAEAVAAAWMDRAEAMRTLYIQVFVRELTLENPPPAIPEERVARFVSVIGPLRAHVGAQALGWYRYERGEHADGAKWFRSALDWWPPVATAARGTVASVAVADRDLPAPLLVARLDGKAPISAPVAIGVPPSRALRETDPNGPEAYAKTWEGYALTLRGLGRLEDAERIAYDWRDRSTSLRALFIEMAVTALTRGAAPPAPERLDRYTTLVRADRSVRGAQALGWFWTDRKDWTQAADWFRSAIDWSDKAGTDTDPKVVQGYGLALRNLGRSDDVMALVAAWRDRIPGMENLAVDLWLDELRALKPPAAMAPDRLARVVAQVTGDRSAVGAQALGWYFYGRTDAAQASAWFKSSFDWSPDGKGDPKAAEGYALALRSAGKLDDALRLADDWRERAPEMGSLYLDLATDLLSGAHPPATLPGDFLTRIGSLATAARAPQVAAALGWYRLEHRGADQAAEWFKSAIDWSADRKGNPKVNEGYVLALRSLGRASDAEAITAAWADSNDALRAQYVDILAERLGDPKNTDPATEDTLRRFAGAVVALNSPNGAQALGWYSYNKDQLRPAVAWFGKAMSWEASEGAATGLALSYRRLNDTAQFTHVVETYRDTYPRIADLLVPVRAPVARGAPAPRQVAVSARLAAARVAPARSSSAYSAYSAKDYPRCVAAAESQERGGRASASDSLVKGWCLMALERPQEAALAFDRAIPSGGDRQRQDAAYGKSLALLRSGETDGAAMAAQQAPLSTEKRNEIGIEVLTQRALAAYRAERFAEVLDTLDRRAAYASERRDLLMLRGWSLYHLDRYDAAQRVFSQVDRQLSSRDSQQALAAVENKLTPQRSR